MPSCVLMFKQELPLMFPDDADVQAVKEAMWDPFEYLMLRAMRKALLKTDFKKPLGKVAYHAPATSACRTSAQDPRSPVAGAGTEVDMRSNAVRATTAPRA